MREGDRLLSRRGKLYEAGRLYERCTEGQIPSEVGIPSIPGNSTDARARSR